MVFLFLNTGYLMQGELRKPLNISKHEVFRVAQLSGREKNTEFSAHPSSLPFRSNTNKH